MTDIDTHNKSSYDYGRCRIADSLAAKQTREMAYVRDMGD